MILRILSCTKLTFFSRDSWDIYVIIHQYSTQLTVNKVGAMEITQAQDQVKQSGCQKPVKNEKKKKQVLMPLDSYSSISNRLVKFHKLCSPSFVHLSAVVGPVRSKFIDLVMHCFFSFYTFSSLYPSLIGKQKVSFHSFQI